jgi:copper/silver efflux system protein
MIRKIVTFSAQNRVLVILLAISLVLIALYSLRQIKMDAIPDLSDTQVIIYGRWERSPDIIEDQLTYPVISALLGAPKVKAIRGYSDFGFSYIYVIFEDGTDIYWARSRILEYLSKIQGSLPEGVKVELGPDASGVGWVYQYALIDRSGKYDPYYLRSYQDFVLRYALESVPGVAEVASIGGYQKQYQVKVDPGTLRSYNISTMEIFEALKGANWETGGRLVEFSGKEYMVRTKGYIKNIEDIENIVIRTSERGTPVLLKNVAQVALGPQIRRGALDFDGEGETAGGIVVMRHNENALEVIERIKSRLEELKQSLPDGIEIVPAYDRSGLILDSIKTLKGELIIEMIIVSFVILLFLWHIPSASVPILTIPVSVLLAFIPMYFLGITSNIMSISGIAISIGVLVDGAIVEVENAYKKLELWIRDGRKEDFHTVRLEALLEVVPSVFFSLLVIAVSFLPIFTLVAEEGRMFRPLAWTKTLTILIATILAITLDPAIRMLFTRMEPFHFSPPLLSKIMTSLVVGKYYEEEKHPVSRVLFSLYEKPCRFVLDHPGTIIASAVILVLLTVPVYLMLGSEFMPPLNEGTILYMPTTLPGISIREAGELLQNQDRVLRSFPEVATVFGKAGRADTSTDPAPLSMIETTVVLKPESEWRAKDRWYSSIAPEFLKGILRHLWMDKISYGDLITEMNSALNFPGSTNAFTMPIKGRIDMLSTGVRTPLGIKILGSDLKEIESIGLKIEKIVKAIKGTRSVFSERTTGGYFVDIIPDRGRLSRYGLTIEDVNGVIETAMGGETATETVEGRERYSVNLRYFPAYRSDIESIEGIILTAKGGLQVPLKEVAEVKLSEGPSMLRDENGKLAGYVFIDIENRDLGSYVKEVKERLSKELPLPAGYYTLYSGQYENMMRVKERLKLIIPITLFLIFLLIYVNTRSTFKTIMVMLAVPFSLVGAVVLMYLLHYNISVASWVGMIALMGLDAETGIFMLLFLDLSYGNYQARGMMRNCDDLKEAIVYGAVKRIRPKMMTVCAAAMGLMPILWSIGTGADMMKRVAAPMVGGLFTSFVLELLIYPPVYLLWKKRELKTE